MLPLFQSKTIDKVSKTSFKAHVANIISLRSPDGNIQKMFKIKPQPKESSEATDTPQNVSQYSTGLLSHS
jgi:hypothetical protein